MPASGTSGQTSLPSAQPGNGKHLKMLGPRGFRNAGFC